MSRRDVERRTGLGSDPLEPSPQRQNIESIVLKLDELFGDVLDAMPARCPVVGTIATDDRDAVDLDTGGSQHRTIDEYGAPTPKRGRDDDDRVETIFRQEIPDLVGRVEADRFDLARGKNL